MRKTEDFCIGCEKGSCIGRACRYYEKVTSLYCDDCGDYFENLYEYEGEELCIRCIEKRLPEVQI